MEGMYEMWMPEPCACVEWNSLVGRHLKPSPQQECFLEIPKTDFRVPKLETTTYADIISGYVGPKRAMYQLAREELRVREVHRRDARVASFVKKEKLSKPKLARLIQARSPVYNLAVAKYLKPFERWFYESEFNGAKFVTKGMSLEQRADLLVDAWSQFDNPMAILLDHSTFDACVTENHLKTVHKIYQRACRSKHLRYLLKMQLRNRGCTKNGIRYRVKATRMSGDFDTALGNTLINYLVIRQVMGSRKFRLLIDGDDSVVVCEKHRFDPTKFKQLGFNTKVQFSYQLQGIDYCSHRLVVTPEGSFFARSPFKILSSIQYAVRKYQGHAKLRYLAGVAYGELHRSGKCPMVGGPLHRLANLVPRDQMIFDERTRYLLHLPSMEHKWTECRDAYAEVFGVSPAEQVKFEQTPWVLIRDRFVPQSWLGESRREI